MHRWSATTQTQEPPSRTNWSEECRQVNIIKERTGSVIAWIGSGISAAAGLPTWRELKDRLLFAAHQKSLTYEEDDKEKLSKDIKSIQAEPNLWISFLRLKRLLGYTSYRETIRECLTTNVSNDIPKIYNILWKLNLRGVFNLNIDRLASRAFAETLGIKSKLNEISGNVCKDMLHILQDPCPFIANLHGTIEDYASWIFTRDELNTLLNNEGYNLFVKTCLAHNTILFIGISADDIAAGGHLERLTNIGINTPTHYWVTDRRDRATDAWAESVGIRIIRYNSAGDDHSALVEFATKIFNFLPIEDESYTAVIHNTNSHPPDEHLPEPSTLVTYKAETIRSILNYHANKILTTQDGKPNKEFDEFCLKYDEAIYRSWYTSTSPGSNILFGYTLEKYIGRGAFGKVCKAVDGNQNYFAVKILLEDIRKDSCLLNCFRRGIRSMKILKQHNVPSMVTYKDASEIPAFVVMDWIDGLDLKDAIESKQISSWEELIEISYILTKTIHTAHSLPERVLHRDIRPTNVMLKNYYTDPTNLDIIVMDFDLSWHKGSAELSVTHGSSMLGYLAPEQIQATHGISTRNAAVDSFGLGMTFYFMVARCNPIPDQHRHSDWENTLYSICKNKASNNWRSIGKRFARLILNSTQDKQATRWDVNHILLELSRLKSALRNEFSIDSAELIAEEIISRTSFSNRYKWDPDLCGSIVESNTGLSFSLIPNEPEKNIILTVKRLRQDYQHRKNAGRSLTTKVEQSITLLKSAQWRQLSNDTNNLSINFKCVINIMDIIDDPNQCITSLEKTFEILSFA